MALSQETSFQFKGTEAEPLIRLILRNPVFANILMLIFILIGIFVPTRMVRESFPQFELDFIEITVAYPGADPAEVEESVVLRIEDSLEGIAGIRRVMSTAAENIGVVIAEVEPGENRERVRREIKNRVDAIQTFPGDAERPVVSTFQFDDAVINVALWGDATEREGKLLAKELRDELLQLEGVSRVNIIGTREAQISIEISELKLQQYGLRFDDVRRVVQAASQNIPGGSIRTQDQDIALRVMGRRYYAQDFGDVVIRALPDGTQVQLRDVAELRDTFDDTSSVYGLYNGNRAVNLQVLKGRDEDTIDIAQKVHAWIDERGRQLPASLHLSPWFDTSRLVEGRIDLLKRNGLVGIGLVFLSLLLVMDLRLSFWVVLGIGVSIGGAFGLMFATGQTINLISLFGLIMVLGIIVDDAIVVGEAIYSHRENGEEAFTAAEKGMEEVVWPVLTAVITTMVAFGPLFFVSGVIGKFISVLPGPVVAALFISLFEALIILPVHLRNLPDVRQRGFSQVPWWNPLGRVRAVVGGLLRFTINRLYGPSLHFLLRWRYVGLATGLAAVILSSGLVASGIVGYSFFPKSDSDYIHVMLEMPPGTPLSETEAASQQLIHSWQATAESFAERIPADSLAVALYANIGGTLGVDDSNPRQGDNLANVFVELMPTEDRNLHYEVILQRWRETTGVLANVESVQFLGAAGGPPGGDVQLDVVGGDTAYLAEAIDVLVRKIRGYGGITDVTTDYRPGRREIRLKLRQSAHALGLTVADLGQQIRAGFYGDEALRVQRDSDDVRIMIRYTESERRTIDQIRHLRIRTPTGAELPLHKVAELESASGFAKIHRENGRRRVSVRADATDGTNTTEIMTDLLDKVLPELTQQYGITAQRGFDAQDRVNSVTSITWGGLVALIAIYLIMATIFHSYLQPAVIMFAIPFGLVGAIIGHLIYRIPLSMMSFFGLVALTGIVVNDAIVLIVAINNRLKEGVPVFQAIEEGAKRRFRAIILTSLTTFAGLFPIILERSFQAQILIPMGVAIAFGVLFATIGTLLVIPCLLAVLSDIRMLVHCLWHWRWPESRNAVEPSFLKAQR